MEERIGIHKVKQGLLHLQVIMQRLLAHPVSIKSIGAVIFVKNVESHPMVTQTTTATTSEARNKDQRVNYDNLQYKYLVKEIQKKI